MKQRSDRGRSRLDADGVRIADHGRPLLVRSVPLIVTAVALSLVALLVIRTFDRPEPVPRADPTRHAVIDSPRTPVSEPTTPPTRVREPGSVKNVRAAVRRRAAPTTSGNQPQAEGGSGTGEQRQPEIDARDYIAALRAGGETKGLAAFSPPGTRPPRSGVIVPDDYVLPEGFARHYQTTDDGRRLAPILTLAPEYDLVDDAGNPVPLVDDRIVPPEFAPPDLPVRMLEVPSDRDRGRGDR